uniref:Uncharacterized protein n=1 Tax=Aegilops tauschii subsp. strangulata TaxID=200361 RepID=A0A453E8I0_AEGTS
MGGGHNHALPAMTFPQFDGENPWLWKGLCEQYFSMYGVDQSFWLPMAMLKIFHHHRNLVAVRPAQGYWPGLGRFM